MEEAAIRDLTRAREDTRSDLKDAKYRRNAFFLRHDSRSSGRAHWRPAHLRWLSEVVWPTPAPQRVLHEDVQAVSAHTARRERLDQERPEPVQAWRWHPVVEARQALRGVHCTVAVMMVAEMGALTRFETPRALRRFWGLMPSEYSSGERRQQGALTKAGNTQARRALVAGAWAYRYPAKVRRHRQLRLEKHSKMIQDISWKAPGRLGKRYRQLLARGQHANVVTVAMARELVGCLWAIAPQVPVTP